MSVTIPLGKQADILVVDDHSANVELLLALLEDEGYSRVEGITDPRQVEPRVIAQRPDLILLDVRMPWLNGFEVMERLQALLGERGPAIIFLTAQIDDDTRYRALSLGAQDFITKPFDHVEVLQRIRNTLQQQLMMDQRQERADLLESLVRERTQALERLSREDPVTGLPNRRALMETLQQMQQEQRSATVFFLAMSGLRDTASLHGYTVADSLVRGIATALLTQSAPQRVQLGVWNSSEWVLIYEGDELDLAALAQPLLELFARPFCVEQMQLYVHARLGINGCHECHPPEHYVRMAALAVPPEPGTWRGYSQTLELSLSRQLQMQNALRQALVRQEFHLLFQPKIDLQSGRMQGAEVLLRWENASFGKVSPAEFIPLAESSGEIVPIGDWVLRQAVETLVRWRQQGQVDERFSLAVNVASRQLMDPHFAARVQAVLQQAQLPASVLEVEVTESGLMQNMQLAMEQLEQLHRFGIRIAIDDFGTGYSSLAYLKSLPVSVLKIDRAFVGDLHCNDQDRRLTETVVAMARNFGFLTVAEGVENPEQLAVLTAIGCDLVQGFLFAPPLKETVLLTLASRIFPLPTCTASAETALV